MGKFTRKFISVYTVLAMTISMCTIETEHVQAKVEGAKVGEAYTLETTAEQFCDTLEFKAPYTGTFSFTAEHANEEEEWDGYGYVFDSSVDVDAKIAEANEKIADGVTSSADLKLSDYIAYDDDENEDSNMPYIEVELIKDQTYYYVLSGYNASEYGKATITINCMHIETTVKNRTVTSCAEGGYSGDVHCAACDELVEEGTQIEGHEPENELVNVIEANCYEDGYSGDTRCSICGITTEGTTTSVSHEYENDVCKNCDRIQNAELNKEYTLDITEEQPYQVIEFTASFTGTVKFNCDYVYDDEDNYTYWDGFGYLFDGSVDIDTKIAAGIENIRNEKKDSEDVRLSGTFSTSDDVNEGLPVIEEELEKNQKYYYVLGGYDGYDYGTAVVTIKCLHDETEVKNATITSCTEGGYSGDTYCKLCGELLAEGQQIEAGTDHNYSSEVINYATCISYAEIKYACTYCGDNYTEYDEESGYGGCNYINEGYIEATCTTDGREPNLVCEYCGDVEYEGKVITAYHNQVDEEGYNPNYIYDYKARKETCEMAGYTGDVICSVCYEVFEKGTSISPTDHKFVDGTCTKCGIIENLLPKDNDGYYLIDTVEDLMIFIINADKGIKGKLTADITFPENYENDDLNYECASDIILDGNGHTIKGFNIYGEGFSLFENMEYSIIKNLNVECDIDSDMEFDSFGILAQNATHSTFENCTVDGTIISSEEMDDIGGFIGYAEGCTFVDCTNNADITSEGGNIGGVIGDGNKNTFTNCVNNGDIYADEDEVGGIAGETDYGIFENCVNNGKISTEDEQAGGIAGNTNTAIFTNCKNYGDIICISDENSADEIGGIVGSAYESTTITECENYGTVGNSDTDIYIEEVGGIVGQLWDYGKIVDCVNNGNVYAGDNRAGGICGDFEYEYDTDVLEITGCINNGNVYADKYAGGIMGEGIQVNVNNCVNNGNISGNFYVASIIGYAKSANVDKVYNTGKIECTDEETTAILIYGEDDVTVTNSEENHTHKYDIEKVIKPATTTTEGQAELVCKCGYSEGKTIALKKLDPETTTKTEKETTTKVTKPAKTKIKSLKNVKTKKIKLTWKKLKGVKGYQVRYSTNKKFKKAKIKIVKTNKTKLTIKKLQKKKYYVQVRAYKVVNGKKQYGKWSKRKAVIVKR